MNLSNWNHNELVALAEVYLRHRQFDKSHHVREELKARLAVSDNANLTSLLRQFSELESKPISARLLKFFAAKRAA